MSALDEERKAHQVCVEMRDEAYAEIKRLRAALDGAEIELELLAKDCEETAADARRLMPDGPEARVWLSVAHRIRHALKAVMSLGQTTPKG